MIDLFDDPSIMWGMDLWEEPCVWPQLKEKEGSDEIWLNIANYDVYVLKDGNPSACRGIKHGKNREGAKAILEAYIADGWEVI